MTREDYERAEAEERDRACGELTTHEFVWIPLKDGQIDRTIPSGLIKILAETLEEAKEQVIDDLVDASLNDARRDRTDVLFLEASKRARDEAREQEGKTWLVMKLY